MRYKYGSVFRSGSCYYSVLLRNERVYFLEVATGWLSIGYLAPNHNGIDCDGGFIAKELGKDCRFIGEMRNTISIEEYTNELIQIDAVPMKSKQKVIMED